MMHKTPNRFVWMFALFLLLAGSRVYADGPKAVKANAEPATLAPAEKEKAALAFATEHHSELAELLKNLKSSNRQAYDKGIQHLARDSERLSRTKTNNPARYELELELWKTESRIRLTAARTMMDESQESLKEELRNLIAHREDVKLQILKQTRERTASQLSKIDADIAAAESGREGRINRELDTLIKNPKKRDIRTVNAAGKKAAADKASANPEEKTATDKKAAPKK